jgi:antibiotic biosynthesis monooxygenase (ABM) superfamily enzyme
VAATSSSREQEQEKTGPAWPSELIAESTADEGRSVIFTIKAKPGQEEALAEWTHRIVAAGRAAEGNLAATVIGTPHPGEYRVFHHFQDAQSLRSWLDSSERQQLLAEAEPILESTPTGQLETGLETWFHLPSQGPVMFPPPRWKMWLTSVIAIYPLILAFQAWLSPRMVHWPLALRAALLPLVILTLMTYVVMPVVTRVLKPWLMSRR